ncbi:MAG: outer membrane protein transport protein [Candidatus Cloacimonadaceae bacterium]
MRTLKLGLLTVILLTLCVGSLFAGGFALSGIGSKAISLGGAFRGLADDGTAMYWNPAGLGFMERSFITLAGAGIMPVAEYQSEDILPGISGEAITAEEKLWLFPNLYAVKGGQSRMKFGLGVYVPYGLGAEWDIYDLPTGNFNLISPTDTTLTAITWSEGFPEKEMMSSIGIVDIHPTVAYQFSEHFALGAGLSVYYGMIEITKVKPHGTFGYNLPTLMELEGTGLGFGGNLGLMYKINEHATMGISGKMPAKVKMDGEATVRTWLSNYVNYMSQVMAENPNAYLYAVNAVIGDTTDIKADLNLPGDIGFGVSIKPNPRWTINADVSYTFWNTLNTIIIEFDPPAVIGPTTMEESEMITLWKDTFRFSFGTEYKFNKVALRGGFFYDESPIPYNTLNPTLPDISDKYSGNVGLGFHLGNWIIDVNYEHIMFDERKITPQTSENMFGIYNSSVDAFNFGLTFLF